MIKRISTTSSRCITHRAGPGKLEGTQRQAGDKGGCENDLCMSIADDGHGFDPEAVLQHRNAGEGLAFALCMSGYSLRVGTWR